MKRILTLLALVSMLVFMQGCKKQSGSGSATLTVKRLNGLALTDATTDEVIGTVESLSATAAARSVEAHHYLPSCVTVTRAQLGDTLSVTWQFAEGGCQMPNGRIYEGSLVIQHIHHTDPPQLIIRLNDDFAVDSVDVDGYARRTHLHLNEDGNPQSTVAFDVQVTPPHDQSFHATGERTRVMVEGFRTARPDDNVWEITGRWTVEYAGGDTYMVKTLTPLRKTFGCRWYVSGTVSIRHNDLIYTLDYGDGTCDNEATLTTPDGQTQVIELH